MDILLAAKLLAERTETEAARVGIPVSICVGTLMET